MPAAPIQLPKVPKHAANREQDAEEEIPADQRRGVQQFFTALARRTAHHVRLWLFSPQRQGRQCLRAKVDRQDLQRGQRQWQIEQSEEYVRHCFAGEVREDVRDELADIVVHRAPFFHRRDDACEIIVGKDHRRRFLRHVSAGSAHGDANVRTLERRRIVHAVPGDCDDLAQIAERGDHAQLVLGRNTRKDHLDRIGK